jgi:hypothetical protein
VCWKGTDNRIATTFDEQGVQIPLMSIRRADALSKVTRLNGKPSWRKVFEVRKVTVAPYRGREK